MDYNKIIIVLAIILVIVAAGGLLFVLNSGSNNAPRSTIQQMLHKTFQLSRLILKRLQAVIHQAVAEAALM